MRSWHGALLLALVLGGAVAYLLFIPARIAVYDRPGCDGTVAPVLVTEINACLMQVCGCDGTILAGCGVWRRPWTTDESV